MWVDCSSLKRFFINGEKNIGNEKEDKIWSRVNSAVMPADFKEPELAIILLNFLNRKV